MFTYIDPGIQPPQCRQLCQSHGIMECLGTLRNYQHRPTNRKSKTNLNQKVDLPPEIKPSPTQGSGGICSVEGVVVTPTNTLDVFVGPPSPRKDEESPAFISAHAIPCHPLPWNVRFFRVSTAWNFHCRKLTAETACSWPRLSRRGSTLTTPVHFGPLCLEYICVPKKSFELRVEFFELIFLNYSKLLSTFKFQIPYCCKTA